MVDAAGRGVPVADDGVSFQVSGSGRIIGVGNGDPSSHEPDKGDARHAFNGKCVVIVQATAEAGEIRVDATAPGLAPGSVTVTGRQATPRPAVG